MRIAVKKIHTTTYCSFQNRIQKIAFGYCQLITGLASALFGRLRSSQQLGNGAVPICQKWQPKLGACELSTMPSLSWEELLKLLLTTWFSGFRESGACRPMKNLRFQSS